MGKHSLLDSMSVYKIVQNISIVMILINLLERLNTEASVCYSSTSKIPIPFGIASGISNKSMDS